MPRSISSSHSRTATNSSSQHGSSYSSTKPPSVRSATGSFSTINSGPFIHADDLDTTIQWIPSYYLDDVPPQQSPVGSPRRNALVPDTPTSSVLSSAFSSKVSLLPHGLMHLIRTSELERPTKEMFLATVRMMVYISHQLFPPSHILRKDVAHDIENIAQDICEFLDLVQDKLQERLDAANSANAKLPDNELQDEVPLEEVIKWVDIIDGLHRPTHIEAKIFRRIATLYDEFVYMPFLQLHRREPEHNMFALLDTFLDAIFIRLRAITSDATSADKLVHHIEQTLDATMTRINKASASKRHVPSRSEPVADVHRRVLGLRQRENTL
ncbi:hypothetical protein D6D18_04391 [Aureobasidium pullulans]|nr:hypothetical protein D6D18_04391 [Aureobasidium pullulans]